MENQTGRIRKHIQFYGWVKGVGFRYRAEKAANFYGCTGWVRNEYDGSVTMEIQGTEEQIDQVILAIERGTYVRVPTWTFLDSNDERSGLRFMS